LVQFMEPPISVAQAAGLDQLFETFAQDEDGAAPVGIELDRFQSATANVGTQDRVGNAVLDQDLGIGEVLAGDRRSRRRLGQIRDRDLHVGRLRECAG
jgi:hypothetical protein